LKAEWAKVSASGQGLARVEAAALSHGERQLVLLLASEGLAAPVDERQSTRMIAGGQRLLSAR